MVTSPPAEASAPFAPPRVMRIAARRRETHDTVSLDVEDPATRYAPGQFNMLYAFGQGEVPISISAVSNGVVTHTVRSVGRVTEALAGLRAGAALGVRGPFGRGWPVAELRGKDVVVVAGGLGLAPLRPAVHELLAHRADYGRLVLLYGARTPIDLLFTREFERWRGRFDIEAMVTVDAADRSWRGEVGVVTKLFGRLTVDTDQAAALVCGPEIMMRFAAAGLVDAGLDEASIWLSMERNMHCGAGVCGHCQLGPFLLCRDGPVMPLSRLAPLLRVKEL
jgi:NAD(P)H-flavin reductase